MIICKTPEIETNHNTDQLGMFTYPGQSTNIIDRRTKTFRVELLVNAYKGQTERQMAINAFLALRIYFSSSKIYCYGQFVPSNGIGYKFWLVCEFTTYNRNFTANYVSYLAATQLNKFIGKTAILKANEVTNQIHFFG